MPNDEYKELENFASVILAGSVSSIFGVMIVGIISIILIIVKLVTMHN